MRNCFLSYEVMLKFCNDATQNVSQYPNFYSLQNRQAKNQIKSKSNMRLKSDNNAVEDIQTLLTKT